MAAAVSYARRRHAPGVVTADWLGAARSRRRPGGYEFALRRRFPGLCCRGLRDESVSGVRSAL